MQVGKATPSPINPRPSNTELVRKDLQTLLATLTGMSKAGKSSKIYNQLSQGSFSPLNTSLNQLENDTRNAGITGYAAKDIQSAIIALTKLEKAVGTINTAISTVNAAITTVGNVSIQMPQVQEAMTTVSQLLLDLRSDLLNGDDKDFKTVAQDLYKFAYTVLPNLIMGELKTAIIAFPQSSELKNLSAEVRLTMNSLGNLFIQPNPTADKPVGIDNDHDSTWITNAIGFAEAALAKLS